MAEILVIFLINLFVPYGSAAGNFDNVSAKCTNQFMHFSKSLEAQHNWALESEIVVK